MLVTLVNKIMHLQLVIKQVILVKEQEQLQWVIKQVILVKTDMQLQLRSADAAHFPDLPTFQGLHDGGQLTSPHDAARRVVDYLNSPNFGQDAVGDVRG